MTKQKGIKLTPEMGEILDSLIIEQGRVGAKINNYLRQCAVVLGLDPDKIIFNGDRREFEEKPPQGEPQPPAPPDPSNPPIPFEKKRRGRKPKIKEE